MFLNWNYEKQPDMKSKPYSVFRSEKELPKYECECTTWSLNKDCTHEYNKLDRITN